MLVRTLIEISQRNWDKMSTFAPKEEWDWCMQNNFCGHFYRNPNYKRASPACFHQRKHGFKRHDGTIQEITETEYNRLPQRAERGTYGGGRGASVSGVPFCPTVRSADGNVVGGNAGSNSSSSSGSGSSNSVAGGGNSGRVDQLAALRERQRTREPEVEPEERPLEAPLTYFPWTDKFLSCIEDVSNYFETNLIVPKTLGKLLWGGESLEEKKLVVCAAADVDTVQDISAAAWACSAPAVIPIIAAPNMMCNSDCALSPRVRPRIV